MTSPCTVELVKERNMIKLNISVTVISIIHTFIQERVFQSTNCTSKLTLSFCILTSITLFLHATASGS